jgi:orotidine-5'-phosphate decarboxylase
MSPEPEPLLAAPTNTVGRACAAATWLGVWMLNVHATGGRAMLVAARESVARINKSLEVAA